MAPKNQKRPVLNALKWLGAALAATLCIWSLALVCLAILEATVCPFVMYSAGGPKCVWAGIELSGAVFLTSLLFFLPPIVPIGLLGIPALAFVFRDRGFSFWLSLAPLALIGLSLLANFVFGAVFVLLSVGLLAATATFFNRPKPKNQGS